MSEEKEVLLGFLIGSISILRDMNIQFTEKSRNKLADKIMELIKAYEKEKGENVKLRLQDIPLIEGELKAYKDRVSELKAELEKEKEKNKELNRLKGFEMLDIFNMGKQSSRQRIEFDYVDKEKIKAGIEVARKKYNDLHTKHLRDCGIAEQRELAKIEFGESLLKEE